MLINKFGFLNVRLFFPNHPVVGQPVEGDGQAEDGDDLVEKEVVAKQTSQQGNNRRWNHYSVNN